MRAEKTALSVIPSIFFDFTPGGLAVFLEWSFAWDTFLRGLDRTFLALALRVRVDGLLSWFGLHTYKRSIACEGGD
jgi:hypothetical protein